MTRLAGHVRTARTPEGTVLLDVQGGKMFALNPTGARILELLEAGTAIQEIGPQLAREFSVAPETTETDTVEFLTQLGQHTLVDPPE
jgi:hypothetical protein